MSKRVKDTDKGYGRFLRSLGSVKASMVLVGIRQGRETEDGQSLALIAATNEFGTADGHIPERSFLRSTVDKNRARYLRELTEVTKAALNGQDPSQGLGRLGLRVVADVQMTIRNLMTPPNAPATIAKKGVDNPLIDTGRLRQSIEYEVRTRGLKGGGQ